MHQPSVAQRCFGSSDKDKLNSKLEKRFQKSQEMFANFEKRKADKEQAKLDGTQLEDEEKQLVSVSDDFVYAFGNTDPYLLDMQEGSNPDTIQRMAEVVSYKKQGMIKLHESALEKFTWEYLNFLTNYAKSDKDSLM